MPCSSNVSVILPGCVGGIILWQVVRMEMSVVVVVVVIIMSGVTSVGVAPMVTYRGGGQQCRKMVGSRGHDRVRVAF